MSDSNSLRPQRLVSLHKSMKEKILVLDGAMGTAIQDKNLTAKDFGGDKYEGCNEYLVITRPDVIEDIHRQHLAAGCDIVETNSFGGTAFVLEEFFLGRRAYEINFAAAQLARKAADLFATPEKPRFVAGSIGPTTKAMSVTGGITFDELQKEFYDQVKALWEGGVDFMLLETCQDTRNVKAGILAVQQLRKDKGEEIPLAISVTIEPMGTMLAGQNIEALLASVEHLELLYLGLNCATGPEFMTDPIRTLSATSPFPVACVPNAGLPDENGHYLESPHMVGAVLGKFIEKGWINVLGGCCGTHAGHIEELAKLAAGKTPRPLVKLERTVLSGTEAFELTDEVRPVIVGERTNVIGSRKFKKLIADDKFDDAAEVARGQIRAGAQVLDVCLANPDRNEYADMERFLEMAIRRVRVPLMIDSTDEKVVELGLKYSQGKSVINSVNLEDGEERFEAVIPLANRYGAAVVVGTIDEDPVQGMAVTRQRKLEVAERSYELLTKKYGLAGHNIIWDPLVFPCATGDKQYVGSAVETIEGIRLIKQKFPHTKTILGISNVSFGLPPEGREVLNSIFLYHCVQAGLDMAIVNSEKLERYADIPEEEKKLSDDLLWNRGADPVMAFTEHFRSKKPQKKEAVRSTLPLEERLARNVIEGSKEGLIDDLNEALKKYPPLEIINGPLMKGMDEVGKLFGKNQLIVAEVLQSAEVMKAAVGFLETKMERKNMSSRGKILLATVKGDVHDIGKNLVEIILANNGFHVINLGIKIPPERLIEAIREHSPDIVGLSGLLVKSAQQMVLTAEDMTRAGSTPPMLVGGAALTRGFVQRQIRPAYGGTVAYAKDAMNGLDLAKMIVDPVTRKVLEDQLAAEAAKVEPAKEAAPALPVSTKRSSKIKILTSFPAPPDEERHVLKNTAAETLWPYINPMMLYGRHLGVKGAVARGLETMSAKEREALKVSDPKSYQIYDAVNELKAEYRGTEFMATGAVYRFVRVGSSGNTVWMGYRDDGRPVLKMLEFPRQSAPDGLSLADFVAPLPDSVKVPMLDDLKDNMALFAVTVGRGVRELSENLKNRGEYLKSHIVQVLAMESAEAYAEWLHSRIRAQWGKADPMEMTMLERFQAKYSGKRFSFGYPACPRLDDQRLLFDILKPEDIGMQLTEGFMMEPEASVSAIAFHHPEACYFSVGQGGDRWGEG